MYVVVVPQSSPIAVECATSIVAKKVASMSSYGLLDSGELQTARQLISSMLSVS
jgi:hypothetical protein